jgi:hypothetical protein
MRVKKGEIVKIIKKCRKCKKKYEVVNPIDLSQCPLCDDIGVMSPQEFLDAMGIKNIFGKKF